MKKCYKHCNDEIKFPLVYFGDKCPMCECENDVYKLYSNNLWNRIIVFLKKLIGVIK